MYTLCYHSSSGETLTFCLEIKKISIQITVRPETKILDPMKCTTKDGVTNIFKNVQVWQIFSDLFPNVKVVTSLRLISQNDVPTSHIELRIVFLRNSLYAKVISSVNSDRVFGLVSKFGDHMKKVLIYDRIAQGIQDFCANNSIDEVYNARFVELSTSVQASLISSMTRLANDGLNILNLFIPKPDIPPAIAANYREVKIQNKSGFNYD